MIPTIRFAAIVFALIFSLPSAHAVDWPVVADRVQTYPAAQPRTPLLLPSGVAVDAAGNVYIADGTNDRIVVCDAAGQVTAEITKIGDQILSRTMSVRFDASGRLWIADTGNRRVLIRNADGALGGALASTTKEDGDFTDVVPVADGATAWIVDNDRHLLHRFESPTKTWSSFGGKGEDPGKLWHPLFAMVNSSGEVLVADSINGRVQGFTSSGQPARQIGRLGLELGEFHRPTGVAVRQDGTVWVADSTLGVIQVFTSDGGLIDVLRDQGGEPLALARPMGLTFDSNGTLYVVESALHRVQNLQVSLRSAEPALAVSSRPEVGQPIECVACHVDWLPEFKNRQTSILLARPDGDVPFASRHEACQSCHDGTVTDSRRTVWQEHSHGTGRSIPSTMTLPKDLPLTDGTMSCRTCHTAHTQERAGELFREAVTVRKPAAQLCTDCHQKEAAEPATHPFPLSDATGPGESCLLCHRPHGAAADALFIAQDKANTVCLDCHEDSDELHFTPDAGGHSLDKKLTAKQGTALAQLGRPRFSSAQVQCLSCHEMHGARGDHLLAARKDSSELCITCHHEQAALLKSPHDLSRDKQKKNALDHAGVDSGACLFCHSVHQGRGSKLWAATSKPVEDAAAACAECHASTSNLAKAAPPLLHPTSDSVNCATCHDVHAADSSTAMLRIPGEQPPSLCFDCHEDEQTVATSMHQPKLLAGKPHADSFCGPCHKIHVPAGVSKDSAGDLNAMWMVPLVESEKDANARCTGCHPPTREFSIPAHIPIPLRDAAVTPAALVLNELSGSNPPMGTIGCRTCHLHHGRGAPEQFGTLESHQDMLSLQALRPMLRDYGPPPLCGPCHGPDGLRRFLYFHVPPR